MKKIYLAGPLFSEAEQIWLLNTKKKIEDLAIQRGVKVEIIWPYELIPKKEIYSLGERAKFEIFSRCKSHLNDTDILIALLDGPQVDDGTAWEIGYFYRNKSDKSYIIGIRTDFRNAGETINSKVNSMIEASCDKIANSSENLTQMLFELL
ncbi:MAG: nucleoside 2-deoxyribosyltransferase [Nitrospirota bacterium]